MIKEINEKQVKEKSLGITARKDEDFSEWFTQVITKAELIEYTDVSGCYVLKPTAYHVWETIQEYMNKGFKKRGVKNMYFPLFIPESYFKKEAEHVKGFTPEVAWVTHSGETKLNERLAVRPTSETIMYSIYPRWIRSYKDLPLKANQWCNVVRWEFRNPMPFLRSREFLWQEGHTAFATKEEAEKEVLDILDFYEQTYKELLALPSLKGKKTEQEKFAGADYTTSLEIFSPSGKVAQACTSHHLGQNFAKAFDIKFIDNKEQVQYVYQNSWGFTTRSIGIMIVTHSDDKGLVLPPRVAENKVVIVPILFEKTKEKVLEEAEKIKKELKELNPILDVREEYSPGWKFNEWEMKGIPLRIEIGPKDIEKESVMVAKRTGGKTSIKITDLKEECKTLLEEIHKELFDKAKALLDASITEANTIEEMIGAVGNKKIALSPLCSSDECEEGLKAKTEGAKTLNIPFDQPSLKNKKCIICDADAEYYVYIGKSY